MRIFVTGATGWIGSAAVDELIASGHDVAGLARTDASAAALSAQGATAVRGDLDDLDSLRRGAQDADAVVYLANKHDWSNPAENDRTERAAIEAIVDTMAGTDRPLMVANGLTGLKPGGLVLETDASPEVGPTADRGGSENFVLDATNRGVRGLVVRFAPTVHGAGDWGFVNFLTAAARERGVSGYVGDGSMRWSAVHRGDAARLIRLGIERAPGATRLHAVAEEAIEARAIAEAIGDALDLPVRSIDPADADEHFGFVAEFFAQTLTASSERTRQLLDWTPTGPGLLEDIRSGAYTEGDPS